ncbi:MAG: hypothetical protein KF729_09740 [Sandaracinaceae bacterium]|nr:hypothetical protein [Sandaracinaceae bacterium]
MLQYVVSLSVALVLLGACDGGAERCVAGMTVECACPGGGRGVQTCAGDGSFGACECPTDAGAPAPDGGASDAGALDGGAGDGGASDAGEDAGSCPTYVGAVSGQPSGWSYSGAFGFAAGAAQCVALGADHVCDYEELRRAELAGELGAIAAGQTFWLHRLTTVDVGGVPSAPGPGGRCNEWTYIGNALADGEYVEFAVAGTPTYHFDDDTAYSGIPGDGHARPGLDCGGVSRAIPCCAAACP